MTGKRPETVVVGMVFYLSTALIGGVLIGEFPHAEDFFMGMALLPFLISGGMLASRWLKGEL